MTDLLIWFTAAILVYLVGGTALAVLARRLGVRSSADYYVAGYRLGGFLAAMTYAATTYSAFMMVGLVGLTYALGVSALGFELVYLLATLTLLATLGPRLWAMARERGWVSPSEAVADLTGSDLLGLALALTYLVALIPYTSAQVKGIGEIFAALGPGYWVGVAVATALIMLWVVLAGVWSVAVTDAFQGLWMIGSAAAFIVWLLGFSASHGLTPAEAFAAVDSAGLGSIWPATVFIGLTTPWAFFAVTNPQVLQRVFMPKDSGALKRMVYWFGVFGLAYTLLVTFAGVMARGLTASGVLEVIKSRDAVTPTLLTLAPHPLAAVVYVSIVAAAMSTANSIVLSVASSFVRDIYERRLGGTRPILVSNSAVAALAVTAAAIAWYRPSTIVDLSVLSSTLLLPAAAPTIAGAVRPGSLGRWGLAAFLVGEAVAWGGFVAYGARANTAAPVLGLPVPLIALIASLAVTLAGLFVSHGSR